MASRKYATESGLNLLCCHPFLIQHQHLDDPHAFSQANGLVFNIYMICRRPRITFEPKTFQHTDGVFTGELRVQTREGVVPVPFSSPATDPFSLETLDCKYPFNQIRFLGPNGEVKVGMHASHFMMLCAKHLVDPKHIEHLDLEVLYVGQAFGKDGERTAPDRLKTHETLLSVYSTLSATSPESEVWLSLLSFEDPFLVMQIDGRSKTVTETTNEEDSKHLDHLLTLPIDERQQICFAEAALIRYFQPEYNDRFKYSFPNPSHSSYSQCYDADLNAVMVELQFQSLNTRVFSQSIHPAHVHIAQFELHDRERRVSMFDFA